MEDINGNKLESKLKIKCQSSKGKFENLKKNPIELINKNEIHKKDSNLCNKNSIFFPFLNNKAIVNNETIDSNQKSPNVLHSQRNLHNYNYTKSSLKNINLNFNININCQNESKFSNNNKKDKKNSTVNAFEMEEKSNETVYESVIQPFIEKENYLSRLNSKLDKISNLQTEENDFFEKTSSFYSISDSLTNLTNIKFHLDSNVDIYYLKKNLKVLSIKV